MKTRRRIAIGFLFLAGIGAAICFASRPREPVYQGVRLSTWLNELTLGETGGDVAGPSRLELSQRRERAVEAIRALGTNSLPHLLKGLTSRPKASWLRTQLEALLAKQSLVEINLPPQPPDRSWQAVRAFQVLGASAAPAIPKLAEFLAKEEASSEASECLTAIGPASVPVLIRALTNQNERVQRVALSALGDIGPAAGEAVPLLEQVILSPTNSLGDEALRVLSEIAVPTDQLVSLYARQLDDTNRLFGAAFALGRSGPEALPLLLRGITNQNKQGRVAIFAALQPEIRDRGPGRTLNPPDYSFRRLSCIYNLKALGAAWRFYSGKETAAMASALTRNLETPNSSARAMIVDLLASSGLDGVAGLSKARADADASIRARASARLKEIGVEVREGAIIRGQKTSRRLALVFTGHEFADGAATILNELARHHAKASLFLTGDFLANPEFKSFIERAIDDGHYVGPHSDKHLLYCEWAEPRKLLVTREQFFADLASNVQKIERFRDKLFDVEFEPWTNYPPSPPPMLPKRPPIAYFLPPYEHHNQQIAEWTQEQGMILINYTPGTRSAADYTEDDAKNFVSSQAIFDSIVKKEREDPHGLNGFLLLLHIGSGPRRTDKMHARFGELLDYLAAKGYQFVRVDELLEPKPEEGQNE